MIVVMRSGFAEEELSAVVAHIESTGLRASITRGEEQAIVGVIGVPITEQVQEALEVMPGVEKVLRVSKRYKLASRDFHPMPTVITVAPEHGAPVQIGGEAIVVMAGPCSVESKAGFLQAARQARAAGAT